MIPAQSTLTRASLLIALALPFAAHAADETPWLVRVRAVQLESANKDSTGLGLSINDKVVPEFDISYFVTPQFAVELVLTYPQKQTLRSNGVEIGSLKHLPPTLTAQYHVTTLGAFKPYVGAGLNYTRFSDVQFNPAVQAALQPSIDKNSFGLAVQAGFDWALNDRVVLNLDVKKVQIRTDVSSAGVKVGEFKVDPLLIGVGVGYRF
ncbi:MAG: OmpW family outer membrane protein [Rhizobacter sp.]